jgi:hypothetical protein
MPISSSSNAYTDKCFGSFTVLYLFILLRDQIAEDQERRKRSLYLSDRWVCDRMIRLGKMEAGSGRGYLFIK